MNTTMPDTDYRPLPYIDRLEERRLDDIELVVVHATELPDLDTAREYGERIHYPDSRTGNCGHFYIDRDGAVEQWVPLGRAAHHVRGYNAKSIGIELVNRGRWPRWLDSRQQAWPEDYSEAQVAALIELLATLQSKLPGLQYIAGHDELDTGVVDATDNPAIKVRRKVDPGPLFPWADVEAGVDLKRAGTKID